MLRENPQNPIETDGNRGDGGKPCENLKKKPNTRIREKAAQGAAKINKKDKRKQRCDKKFPKKK